LNYFDHLGFEENFEIFGGDVCKCEYFGLELFEGLSLGVLDLKGFFADFEQELNHFLNNI